MKGESPEDKESRKTRNLRAASHALLNSTLSLLSVQHGGSEAREETTSLTEDEIEAAAKKAGCKTIPAVIKFMADPANLSRMVKVEAIAPQTLTVKALAEKNKDGSVELTGKDFSALMTQLESALRDAARIVAPAPAAK